MIESDQQMDVGMQYVFRYNKNNIYVLRFLKQNKYIVGHIKMGRNNKLFSGALHQQLNNLQHVMYITVDCITRTQVRVRARSSAR